jgi:hypothetical protein
MQSFRTHPRVRLGVRPITDRVMEPFTRSRD